MAEIATTGYPAEEALLDFRSVAESVVGHLADLADADKGAVGTSCAALAAFVAASVARIESRLADAA